MKLSKVLDDHGFSKDVKEAVLASGIKDLYPPQASAIKKGILDGKNLLMSVPTAAGKTFIAELAILRSILKHDGRCLYIAPLKALASEKYHEFKEKYSSLGVEVGLAIGDADSSVRTLNKYNVIIATAEKVDSLLRTKAKWLVDALSLLILDEVHFINDGERGPTLEILTARIKQLNPRVQTLALSATVSNAQELANWLDAGLVLSDWRPIPLKEGVYYDEQIKFDKEGSREIHEVPPDDVSKLVLDTLRGDGQVLTFVNSRRSTQAASRQMAKFVAAALNDDERKQLKTLSRKIAGPGADTTKVCRKLADVVTHGVAFHHAGLKPNQRKLIEDNFKNNLIKVICCTPTLAAGVNLPARRAIIRDCKRFESGLGSAYIPTSEYKQCAGRAGRPQYDKYGEAVLIAKTDSEKETLFDRYIHADPEPVMSKLAGEAALRIHILSSIAGGYVFDIKGMLEFIQHTFLHHQKQVPNMLDLISDIFDFLHREKFIEKSGYRFFATTFGSLTSRIYIDPMTSIMLRDGIKLIPATSKLSALGMIHMACCTADSTLLNVGKKDVGELESFVSHYYDDFILTPEVYPELDDFYYFLSTAKTTWLLMQWMEEEKEESLCDHFNVGPGDIYRHTEATQWLLYAAGCIADLFHKKKLTFQIQDIRNRLRYGVKEELLDLVRLKGVGRIRARTLYKKGFKKQTDMKFLAEEDLAAIPQIGKSLAADIIKQIHQKPRKALSQA